MKDASLAIPTAARQYRLYHAQRKKFLMWRWFAHRDRAVRAAMWLAKWLDIDDTLEVIDVHNGSFHGSYTRRLNHIEWSNESTLARRLGPKVKYVGEKKA